MPRPQYLSKVFLRTEIPTSGMPTIRHTAVPTILLPTPCVESGVPRVGPTCAEARSQPDPGLGGGARVPLGLPGRDADRFWEGPAFCRAQARHKLVDRRRTWSVGLVQPSATHRRTPQSSANFRSKPSIDVAVPGECGGKIHAYADGYGADHSEGSNVGKVNGDVVGESQRVTESPDPWAKATIFRPPGETHWIAQSGGVGAGDGVAAGVGVAGAGGGGEGVDGEELGGGGVVIAGAHPLQAGLGVGVLPGVPERAGGAGGGAGPVRGVGRGACT